MLVIVAVMASNIYQDEWTRVKEGIADSHLPVQKC